MEENMMIEDQTPAQHTDIDKENAGPAAVKVESNNKTRESISEQNQDHLSSKNGKSVMATGSIAVGSVSAFLHPLVIMNISEHWTRLRAQMNGVQLIYGALIGKQKGRCIEIMNSFELVFDQLDGKVVLDRDYYTHKDAQFKQVFPDLDFLGWYTAGDAPNESDLHFHQQICEINESPVLLKLNPFDAHSKLPIRMFESVIDLVGGHATMLFVEISYNLVTEEAERIGLDHMAKLSSTQQPGQDQNSVVAEHLRCQYNAVKMLRDRVKLIVDYVKDVQSGSLSVNHEILRDAFNLCHRLPVVSSDNGKFNEEFFHQCNDVALLTYLGMVTKASNSINQFVNKFNVLCDKHGMGRRMRMGYH